MAHSQDVERRKTRTLSIGPWTKKVLLAGAMSAVLSTPMVVWHSIRTMMAVQQMSASYSTITRQNVALQIQTHRLTDAVNELRHANGLPPIETVPLVQPPDLVTKFKSLPATFWAIDMPMDIDVPAAAQPTRSPRARVKAQQ